VSKVVYWMAVSLDGFVETRDGKIDWTAPDDELHRFFNDYAGKVGAFLYGRRSYELMTGFWPTADANPSAPEPIAEFARIWRRTPKVVFSKILQHVERNPLASHVPRAPNGAVWLAHGKVCTSEGVYVAR